MGSVRVDYVIGESGETTLVEEDMARYGRASQTQWLVRQIQRLDESDIGRDFNAWPMHGLEGQWGTIAIDVYVVMCQVVTPPPHKRRLGAPVLVKVAGVGPREVILRRLEEIEAEQSGDA